MILFTTGVFNEADSEAVGLAMADQIRDDVVLHPAWELVEEFQPVGGPRWTVLKCLATESGLIADFFVIMEYAVNGRVRMTLCEDYNSVTHTMAHGPKTLAGQNIPYDADGRWTTGTFVLNTDQLGLFHYEELIPNGTSGNYWITVAEDGISLAFTVSTQYYFIHLGAYIPLTPFEIELPLQIMGFAPAQGAITRNPALAGTTAIDVGMSVNSGGSGNLTGPALGFAGSLENNDKLQSDQRVVAEQGMTMYPWFANFEPVIGWALGKQKRMRVGAYGSAPDGFAWGDSYVLDGTLWVPFRPDDVRIWDTGVAA